jgi:peptidoglycan/LPS O-acetylase OafA/YrhL
MKRPLSAREARAETRALWAIIVVIVAAIGLAAYYYFFGDQPPQ